MSYKQSGVSFRDVSVLEEVTAEPAIIKEINLDGGTIHKAREAEDIRETVSERRPIIHYRTEIGHQNEIMYIEQ
jgi:hypothetical protein